MFGLRLLVRAQYQFLNMTFIKVKFEESVYMYTNGVKLGSESCVYFQFSLAVWLIFCIWKKTILPGMK